MARTSTKSTATKSTDELILQERQVKALEKIAVSLDALTLWFEEIQKDEWDARLQFYLAKWLENTEKEN
jgi:hypothetical protein